MKLWKKIAVLKRIKSEQSIAIVNYQEHIEWMQQSHAKQLAIAEGIYARMVLMKDKSYEEKVAKLQQKEDVLRGLLESVKSILEYMT